MTRPGVRIAVLLAVTMGLLAVPTLNVMRGFAGLGVPPLFDVAAVFLAAAALGCLVPPSKAPLRGLIASGMAFFMNATLMTIWYSADSEAKAWLVWVLGLPASILVGAVVFVTSWLWARRGRSA